MSFQKKNVIPGFVKEDYVPKGDQMVVKYLTGKGNNLHQVECTDGSVILVSMPKKYRHTVWLKKDDCLVIDPILEGKKVTGEIVCLVPFDCLRRVITGHQWPNPTNQYEIDYLLKFFNKSLDLKPKRDDFDDLPPSDSDMSEEEGDMEEEEMSSEEEGDEPDEDEGEMQEDNDPEENNGEEQSTGVQDSQNSTQSSAPEGAEVSSTDRNTSRVQLVTSGIVTVTNVLTEGGENDMQSLEFEADEEEELDEASGDNRDVERHANTIRIQVSYKEKKD